MTTLLTKVPAPLATAMLTPDGGMLRAGTATVVVRLKPGACCVPSKGSVKTAALKCVER